MVTCGGPPRLQRRELRLHDSKIVECRTSGDSLLLVLDGDVVVTVGEARTGWSQRIELELSGVSGTPPESGHWITDGELVIGDQSLCVLPLPFERTGPLSLTLDSFVLRAAGLRARAAGDSTFIERLGD